MKYFKQYDDIESDYEVNNSDYIVDTDTYEPLVDLLARCMRNGESLPDRTPGLVEDYETDQSLDYNDNVDQILFPEDYPQAGQPVDNLQTNINEATEQASSSEAQDSE
ncbi:hypothetical protein [Dipodfec virus UOA04_Rod_1143]|nr:hypothetical protein [Dipodfec virus UOA04_Rod_1143]